MSVLIEVGALIVSACLLILSGARGLTRRARLPFENGQSGGCERAAVDAGVVVARRQRDHVLDCLTQVCEVVPLQIWSAVDGARGDHAAPDVHADRCRDDGVDGGDDGPDGRPLPLWAS